MVVLEAPRQGSMDPCISRSCKVATNHQQTSLCEVVLGTCAGDNRADGIAGQSLDLSSSTRSMHKWCLALHAQQRMFVAKDPATFSRDYFLCSFPVCCGHAIGKAFQF